MKQLCDKGHWYTPYTECHICKAYNDKKEREYRRRKEEEYRRRKEEVYYNSQEYADKCERDIMRRIKSRQDCENYMKSIYTFFVITIPFIISYFYNTRIIDIYNDFKNICFKMYKSIKEIINDTIKSIINLCINIILILTVLIIIYLIFIIIISIRDTINYYNKFSHLVLSQIPIQFINLVYYNIKD
jgi:hypothetical protein